MRARWAALVGALGAACAAGPLDAPLPRIEGAQSLIVVTRGAVETVTALSLVEPARLDLPFANPLDLELSYFAESLDALGLPVGSVERAEPGASTFVAPRPLAVLGARVDGRALTAWEPRPPDAVGLNALGLETTRGCPRIEIGPATLIPPLVEGRGSETELVGAVGDQAFVVRRDDSRAAFQVFALTPTTIAPVSMAVAPVALIGRADGHVEAISRDGTVWSGRSLAALEREPSPELPAGEWVRRVRWAPDPTGRVRAWALVGQGLGPNPRVRVLARVGREWVDRSDQELRDPADCIVLPDARALCFERAAPQSAAIYALDAPAEPRPLTVTFALTYVKGATYLDAPPVVGPLIGGNLGFVYKLGEPEWGPLGSGPRNGQSGVGDLVEALAPGPGYVLIAGGTAIGVYDVRAGDFCPTASLGLAGRPLELQRAGDHFLTTVAPKGEPVSVVHWITVRR